MQLLFTLRNNQMISVCATSHSIQPQQVERRAISGANTATEYCRSGQHGTCTHRPSSGVARQRATARGNATLGIKNRKQLQYGSYTQYVTGRVNFVRKKNVYSVSGERHGIAIYLLKDISNLPSHNIYSGIEVG